MNNSKQSIPLFILIILVSPLLINSSLIRKDKKDKLKTKDLNDLRSLCECVNQVALIEEALMDIQSASTPFPTNSFYNCIDVKTRISFSKKEKDENDQKEGTRDPIAPSLSNGIAILKNLQAHIESLMLYIKLHHMNKEKKKGTRAISPQNGRKKHSQYAMKSSVVTVSPTSPKSPFSPLSPILTNDSFIELMQKIPFIKSMWNVIIHPAISTQMTAKSINWILNQRYKAISMRLELILKMQEQSDTASNE